MNERLCAVMAIIKCPECGYSVSENAAACRRCSYPISKKHPSNIDYRAEIAAIASEISRAVPPVRPSGLSGNNENRVNASKTESHANVFGSNNTAFTENASDFAFVDAKSKSSAKGLSMQVQMPRKALLIPLIIVGVLALVYLAYTYIGFGRESDGNIAISDNPVVTEETPATEPEIQEPLEERTVVDSAVPHFFPEDVLPLFELSEIVNASENDDAIILVYLSNGVYSEVFTYYHELLLSIGGSYILQNLSPIMQGLVTLIPDTDRSVYVLLSNGAQVQEGMTDKVAVVVTIIGESVYYETEGTYVEPFSSVEELFINIPLPPSFPDEIPLYEKVAVLKVSDTADAFIVVFETAATFEDAFSFYEKWCSSRGEYIKRPFEGGLDMLISPMHDIQKAATFIVVKGITDEAGNTSDNPGVIIMLQGGETYRLVENLVG